MVFMLHLILCPIGLEQLTLLLSSKMKAIRCSYYIYSELLFAYTEDQYTVCK